MRRHLRMAVAVVGERRDARAVLEQRGSRVGRHGLELREVDLPALAGPLAVVERLQRPGDGVDRGHHVAEPERHAHGILAGRPVSAVMPAPPRARPRRSRRSRHGPVCPMPAILTRMTSGRNARSSSNPSPHRSSRPALKFSTITSQCGTSRASSASPSGVRRLSTMPRLFRLKLLK